MTRGALGCQIDSMLRHPLADAVRAVESQQRAGVKGDGRLGTGFVTPLSDRAPYQNRRMIPCEEWPHRSAATSVAARCAAWGSGTPLAR